MNIYLAHSPYHLILCILNGCLEAESFVILLDDTGNLNWYNNNKVSAFFKHRLIYLSLGEKNLIEKFFNKNNFFGKMVNSPICKLTNYIKNLKPGRIFVFADYLPEVQSIIRSLDSILVTYIEDGSAPYNSHKIKNQKNYYVQKILFGFKYERISVFGTSKLISDSLFTYPELVREENRKKPFKKIEISYYSNIIKFSELYEIDVSIFNEERDISLYLLPPYLDDKLLNEYKKSMLNDFKKNIRSIVKRHPSSKETMEFKDNCWEIDQFIPTELVLILLPNVKKLFSYPSTSLLMAGFYRELECNCIAQDENGLDLFFVENLKSVGVNFI